MPASVRQTHRRCRGPPRHRSHARARAQVEGRAAHDHGDLNQLVATIEKAGDKRVVLLIYGDPMFYGLARYVCDKLGKDRFVVVPHVSQHAARVRPRDGVVGRSLPHRPRQASARRRAGKNPHRPKGRPVHDRPVRPGRRGQGAARSPHRLLHRLRLRKPRRPRRTRHPRHARRNRRSASSTRST